MDECIFCQISRHQAPAKIEYEDEEVIAFHDLHPQAPIHLLVIPKIHVETLDKLKDLALASKLINTISQLVHKLELDQKGYQIRINGGGVQQINHLHFWLLGDIK